MHTCTICGKTALRLVGKNGYCKDHEKEAFAAGAKEGRKAESRRGMNDALYSGHGKTEAG